LKVFDDTKSKGSVIVQGLEEVAVSNKLQAYDILARGATKRRVSETKMNKVSSRSHTVFSITVHQKETSVTGEVSLTDCE
jgi:kinesin family member 11